MSYFEGDQTKGAEETAEASETSNHEDWIAKVVSEKGEKWTDPQVLAKGYVSAQQYIAELERQTKEMREEIEKQEHAKTLLASLMEKGASAEPPETVNDGSSNEENTTPAVGEGELESLVEKLLEKKTVEQVRQQNLKKVDEALTSAYGEKAAETVEQRAKELGLSKERLTELAAESPTAFMKLIGGNEGRKETNHVPESTINTGVEAFTNNSDERNWNYYQGLRRKNPTQYFSPRVQKQLMEDRLRLGDKFWS